MKIDVRALAISLALLWGGRHLRNWYCEFDLAHLRH